MMDYKDEFRYACKEFLSGFAINALRSYGREIGVSNPTKDKKKNVLIEEIVGVLSGVVAPTVPSVRGAPVKNDFVDPKLKEGVEQLQAKYLKFKEESFEERLRKMREKPNVFQVFDPVAEEMMELGLTKTYTGQLETIDGVSVLLPLDCSDEQLKIIVAVEMIRAHDLREGDVITCYAENHQNVLVAVKIVTVNDEPLECLRRVKFDTHNACYPYQRIRFCEENSRDSVLAKLLEWMIVVGKGQRGLVIAPPKSGKSHLLMETARLVKHLNKEMYVFTLLTEQAPEAISYYCENVGGDGVVYTTYEDTPERQMFVAEFILKRAKRYAECGKHVLLLVDSLTALARAFNETDASSGGKVLAGGLESKTIHYLKRYFGTARCLDGNGSLTLLGALSVDTGNPADDLLRSELSAVANLEIVLDEELAKRRIYPAIDILKTQGRCSTYVTGGQEDAVNELLRGAYLSTFSVEDLHQLLNSTNDFIEVGKKAKQQLGKN